MVLKTRRSKSTAVASGRGLHTVSQHCGSGGRAAWEFLTKERKQEKLGFGFVFNEKIDPIVTNPTHNHSLSLSVCSDSVSPSVAMECQHEFQRDIQALVSDVQGSRRGLGVASTHV